MIVATADDLRMAVAGQWLGGTPMRTHAAPTPGGAPFSAPLVVQGIGTDTREDLGGRLFVALRGDNHDAHAFLADAAARGAAAALVDRKKPGFDRPAGLPLLEVADTRVALADLARWGRSRLRGKVVGITGSSGKTTTRRLLHAALGSSLRGSASPKSFNNDIGVPLTVLGAAAGDDYLVCEIGMSHPGEIAPLSRTAAPHVVIVTMAGRAHIGGMGSVQAIIGEKASIVDGLSTNGVAIVNGDQPALVAAVNARVKPGVRVVTFGTDESCLWRLMSRAAAGAAQTITVREPDATEWSCGLNLPGDYNAMNALAAIAAARMLGVSAAAIAGALPTVAPADMRMTCQRVGDVTIFNDAYNANPDAMLASLRAFVELTGGAVTRHAPAASPSAPGSPCAPAASAPAASAPDRPSERRLVTVLGDMLELGSPQAIADLHAEVGRAVAAIVPAVAVFVGEGSANGAAAVRASATPADRQPPVVLHVPTLDAAGVAQISALLKSGDCILLKGSRGSRMEQLIAALEARVGREEQTACSTT